jgi:hypothetical protein
MAAQVGQRRVRVCVMSAVDKHDHELQQAVVAIKDAASAGRVSERFKSAWPTVAQ